MSDRAYEENQRWTRVIKLTAHLREAHGEDFSDETPVEELLRLHGVAHGARSRV